MAGGGQGGGGKKMTVRLPADTAAKVSEALSSGAASGDTVSVDLDHDTAQKLMGSMAQGAVESAAVLFVAVAKPVDSD